MINDLSWIENEKILIYFMNADQFLVKERNENKIVTLLDLLDAACEEWKWAEAHEDIPKKELLVRFAPGERMQRLLELGSFL
ncbi:hypothetical protein D9M68_838010 [compost metagenome]